MNKIISKISLVLAITILALFATAAMAVSQPVANAGPDQYVNSNQSVTLQGSGYNPDGGNITYFWSCSAGYLSNPYLAQPTYTTPYLYQYNNQATYTCTLTVTSNYSFSASDSMTVFVNYNQNQTGGSSVQTNTATNILNNQATLQGNLAIPYISNTNSVWFQWGTTNSYGNETTHQSISSGLFSQNVVNLNANTTYHFRAVAQINSGTIYGQDMTFYTSGSNYYNTGSLTIDKKVINLSSGNLNWSESVNANPYNILSFAITIQAPSNQDLQNVYVRDFLPANLIYKGNLTVNANISYVGGTPSSGINIGTIPAGGITVVAYQVQVAGAGNFNYGNTTLTSTATVTSNQTESQTDNATVFVNRYGIQGATTINTGLTNDILNDSFLIPLMIILLTAWLYFSGRVYRFADWLRGQTSKK